MTVAPSRTELIECLPDDPAERVARIRQHLAHTIYFNGYYKGFDDTPEAKAAKKARLYPWPYERDVTDVRLLLEEGADPVAEFLERLPAYGVLRESTADEREEWWKQWERVETTLNARLAIALGLVPAEALGRVVEALLPQAGALGPLSLAAVRNGGIDKGSQGYADLILKGPESVVLIELKVRGMTTARSYDVGQLLKYCNLALDERASWERPDARRLVHVLLRPKRGGSCVAHRTRWFRDPEVPGGAVRLERTELRALAASAELVEGFDRERALAAVHDLPIFDRHYDDLAACLPGEPLGRWDTQVRRQILRTCALAEPSGRS